MADRQLKQNTEQLFSSRQFRILPESEQVFIVEQARKYLLSFQNTRKLIEFAADLHQWNEGPLAAYWNMPHNTKTTGKALGKMLVDRVEQQVIDLRHQPIRYRNQLPEEAGSIKSSPKDAFTLEYVDTVSREGSILGRCPVAGEKTRCCNLLTLDAVEQCGYACSYCSIQSFYDTQKIFFRTDLRKKLEEIELDPGTLYHIGTGQSSDSLMWGDRKGLLSDLFHFAGQNPNVILELKTKSAQTNWMESVQVPPNVIATWSLNAHTIVEREEHRTASLSARLEAARTAADKGILVGFHLHPIVYFEGWEKEYQFVADAVQDMFSPEETVMVSLGTLTYIRPVLRKLREFGGRSKMLQIPLSEASGKFSYPFETKERLFTTVYNFFSADWKKSVFFYLCMEPHVLWDTVFGRSYVNNTEFEDSMKNFYMKKIELARR